MATAKEKCFQDAVDKLNEGREAQGKPKIDYKWEQGWIRDANGTWSESSWTRTLIYSIQKTLRILDGTQAPRADGTPNPIQFRKPDVTLTRPDGSKVVLDTKFTGADGKPDPWRTDQGTSGTVQKDDYEDINKQTKNDVGEPKLDKNTCKCDGRKQETEKVRVPVPVTEFGGQLFFMPLPAPGTGGLFAPAPGGFGVPAFAY
jgi:hypothetical protein